MKHTQISNDVLDALCKIRLSGEESQVFHFILRKTNGYNKTEDMIALSQFEDGTGISKPHVIRAIKNLLSKNMIAKIGNTYRLNTDFSQWKSLPKKATLPILARIVAKTGNPSLPILDHTKDNTTKDKRQSPTPLKEKYDVSEIWDIYLTESKTKERLTDGRREKINVRLKTYTPVELKEAIRKCFGDRFFSGNNDRGWKANSDYIFRSDEIIDKLLNLPDPIKPRSEFMTPDEMKAKGLLW